MERPLIDCSKKKLRIAGLISGSGKSLISIIKKQKELEADSQCNFEVVGLFSDNPNSNANYISEHYHIPVQINDIKKFYQERNKPIMDKTVRSDFDRETAKFLLTLSPDIVVYAGYIWATTKPLLDSFTSINCHPADLSVKRDGRRAYAGANGVRDALTAGETRLNSTLHVVTEKIDNGPILLISEPVIVEPESLKLDLKERSIKFLRLLNEKSREICAIGIEQISQHAFTLNEKGELFYHGKPIPDGHRL